LLTASLLALGALGASAQGPVSTTFHDFEPNGEYELVVDGKAVPDAEIFRAGQLPAFLLVAKGLPAPALILPRENRVAEIAPAKFVRRADGVIDFAADAAPTVLAPFTLTGDTASWSAHGHQYAMRPRPALTGPRKGSEIEAYNVTFKLRASKYVPDPKAMDVLRHETRKVRVRTVFGSWCPHCQQELPHLLSVEKQLAGSAITFEYYGIDNTPEAWKDPEVQKLKVTQLPTGVVYVDGVESGRLLSSVWEHPEITLATILAPPPKQP
jgi:thiol-disulfide isomerase/thioredoxin